MDMKALADRKKKILEELVQIEKTKEALLKIKKLEDYTLKEKEQFFDALYTSALSQLEYLLECGRELKDASHYTWTGVMRILGKNIFKDIWNKLT